MKSVLKSTPAVLLAATLIAPQFAFAQSGGASWSGGSPYGRLSAQQERAAREAAKRPAPLAVISNVTQAVFAGWTAVPNMGCLPAWDVTVDGSASTASQGSIVRYDWTWATGPGLPGGAADSPEPVQTLRMVGNRYLYTVNLMVTDGNGKTGTTTANITTPLREEPPPASCPQA